MHLTRNESFTYQGKFDCPTCCQLRIWEEEGRPPLVIFSPLPNYSGPSIAKRIEWLAWDIWNQLGSPDGMIVLLHSPRRGPWWKGLPSYPSQVHRVTFAPDRREGFSDPQWQLLSSKDLTALLD